MAPRSTANARPADTRGVPGEFYRVTITDSDTIDGYDRRA